MENYYKNNRASIVCWKSKKNSKCSDAIIVNHLMSQEESGKVSDERILQQLINVAEKVASYCKEYDNILLSVDLSINKQIRYNGGVGTEKSDFYNPNLKFDKIFHCIYYLCGLFSLIYPYSTLATVEVFHNAAIRNIINNYNKY